MNLPKLEPFILSEDELEQQEQESGSSEHWTMSPSPPPSPTSTHSSGSFFSRSLQGFPPISEVGEQPQQASFSLGGSFGRRRAASMKSPPKSPSTPTIVVETSSPAGINKNQYCYKNNIAKYIVLLLRYGLCLLLYILLLINYLSSSILSFAPA